MQHKISLDHADIMTIYWLLHRVSSGTKFNFILGLYGLSITFATKIFVVLEVAALRKEDLWVQPGYFRCIYITSAINRNSWELKAQYDGSNVHCYVNGTVKPSAFKQNTLITPCLTRLYGDKEKTEDSCCVAFLDLPHCMLRCDAGTINLA
jgi:hypothetical protein